MFTSNGYLVNRPAKFNCKTWKRGKLCLTIMLFQLIICFKLILFGVYEETADPSDRRNSVSKAIGGFDPKINPIEKHSPHLRDHMVFSLLGLGLSSASSSGTMLSSLGFNLLTFTFASSWALLWPHLITSPWKSSELRIESSQTPSGNVSSYSTILSFISTNSSSSLSNISMDHLVNNNTIIKQNQSLLSTHNRSQSKSFGYLTRSTFHITIGISSLVKSTHYGLGVTLSLGSLQGKLSPIQCIILAAIEIPIISLIDYVLALWQVADPSNGLTIFIFSVYFGLSVSAMICRNVQSNHRLKFPSNESDRELTVLIGTIFTYLTSTSLYSQDNDHHLLAVNTCISMMSSCLSAFAISSLLDSQDRFSVRHLRIGSAAGGVTMSIIGQYMLHPYTVLIGGIIIGFLSILIHTYGNPYLFNRFRVHDSNSIHATYGIPALISGLASSVFAYMADISSYDCMLYEIFPARAPPRNISSAQNYYHYHYHHGNKIDELNQKFSGIGRSADIQALYQFFGLLFILIVSIIAGLLTGLILIQPIFDPPKRIDLFQDGHYWVLSHENEETFATESLYEGDPSAEDLFGRKYS